MMTRQLAVWTLVAALAPFGAAHAQPSIQWIPDLATARQVAQAQNRPLLIHFWSPECVPCLRLDKDVLSRPDVGQTVNSRFVAVKVNTIEHPELAEDFGVRTIPTDIIAASNGQVLYKTVSPARADTYVQKLTAAIESPAAQIAQRTAQSQLAQSQLAQSPTQPAVNAARTATPSDAAADPSDLGRLAQQQAAQWNQELAASSEAMHQQARDWRQQIHAQSQGLVDEAGANLQSRVDTGSAAADRATDPWGQQIVEATRVADEKASQLAAASQATQQAAGQWAVAAGSNAPAMVPSSPPNTTYEQFNPYVDQGSPTNQPSPTSEVSAPPPVAGQSPADAAGSAHPGVDDAAPFDPSRFSNPATGLAAQLPPPTAQTPIPEPDPAAAAPSPSARVRQVGLEGFCPVTLLQEDRWQPGDRRWGAIHRGRIYLFASRKNQLTFLADPDAFSPVLAGIDPVVLTSQGQAVDGKRAHGLVYKDEVYGDQIYLFSSEQSLKEFYADPQKYAVPVRQAMVEGTVSRFFR